MWEVEFVNELAFQELKALPQDMQAAFERITALIKMRGIAQIHEPYAKHLENGLWEMRLKGKAGIARSIYVTAIGRRVVVLRTFIKKTEKTPRREIELALKRAREIR